MENVISLALPFFGLIFLGIAAGKLKKIPAEGLAWMQFFIIYIALPALFFRLLAKTPIEELTNIGYVAATTFATYCAFAVAFCVGVFASRGNIPEATIQALAGSYSNIGYMGPGLTLAVLGPAAAVPTALVFCFDNILLFTLAPLMMAIGGTENEPPLTTALTVLRRIFTHPFILATIAGVLAAAVEFQPPQAIDTLLTFLSNAAAPCALFAMGVTVALQPLGRTPLELPVVLLVKLVIHPIIVLLLLNWVGGFDPAWVATAVLMACLPPAANVFVIAQQYNVYVQRASSAILIGTIASTVTVSAFIYLITEGLLPLN
ncbi:AEC family transporter [Stappia stellulata]|uniref:AEC family transporter n=1 Tax=Stappia TaxID=152161 RepID=UPI001CD71AD5|nr:AEC family transporter [Stappia stellulata]MCA1241758.1 AEC family transporter [Stappia stellulata]